MDVDLTALYIGLGVAIGFFAITLVILCICLCVVKYRGQRVRKARLQALTNSAFTGAFSPPEAKAPPFSEDGNGTISSIQRGESPFMQQGQPPERPAPQPPQGEDFQKPTQQYGHIEDFTRLAVQPESTINPSPMYEGIEGSLTGQVKTPSAPKGITADLSDSETLVHHTLIIKCDGTGAVTNGTYSTLIQGEVPNTNGYAMAINKHVAAADGLIRRDKKSLPVVVKGPGYNDVEPLYALPDMNGKRKTKVTFCEPLEKGKIWQGQRIPTIPHKMEVFY